MLQVLKSKIHRCRVTAVKPDYEGSLGIDRELAAAAGLWEHERILVANMRNGERFETYVILEPAGSGEVCVNGAAARLCRRGDELIVMAFGLLEEHEAKDAPRPRIVRVDRRNRPLP